MTNPEEIARKLTRAQRQAIRAFQPGLWYGAAQPSKSAAYCKGRLVEIGLIEHDGRSPVSSYRLKPLGLAVRDILKEQSK